ncbi:hypothetical protein PBY51_009355 [Eleginops maclovinus]|uniref:Uncharacterized protein n=1 Tax=Eleginops maclovinus TaxID=56733 RepID=A0AAN8AV01_ELEMC|nr:hypothetical protein PBY51_009355 [Eleginops maclovinus]
MDRRAARHSWATPLNIPLPSSSSSSSSSPPVYSEALQSTRPLDTEQNRHRQHSPRKVPGSEVTLGECMARGLTGRRERSH